MNDCVLIRCDVHSTFMVVLTDQIDYFCIVKIGG